MSVELDTRTSSLGRSRSKRGSISRTQNPNQKLTELRPKGSVIIAAPACPIDFKRKAHAQAQKQQRDRMKAALDRIAGMLEDGGLQANTTGTKAELVEAAVEYIQRLQGEIELLRGQQSGEDTHLDSAL